MKTHSDCPNPNARLYHLRHQLSEHARCCVASLLGVVDCATAGNTYSPLVIKAEAYEWDELHPKILATLHEDASFREQMAAALDAISNQALSADDAT